jgi:hypothetical protein
VKGPGREKGVKVPRTRHAAARAAKKGMTRAKAAVV